ncbi:hypothetical protein [Longimicrobium sp.]|uniref:hypothetical protein n=1 Tax=Longimicrobium sp. TaxID=2029185 RepID=UPI002BE88AD2|nr:hypothetical protein [Longimicrobium sp.]HSU14136.1 hypothetical protein [Longimicrobium sp.]
MPAARPSLLVLDEVPEARAAYSFWRILADLEVISTPARDDGTPFGGADALELPAELGDAARVLAGRESHVPGEVADACAAVWEWAEQRGMPELALQFAEAAARLEPDSSARAATAGRLCRRRSERIRGTLWFRRAARLARVSHAKTAEVDFAIAHLGWGNLESDLGRFGEAEKHADKGRRAALRVGRRSLAASAYHDLMTIRIHSGRLDEAAAHARSAVAFYKPEHPRVPALAHDIAFLWACRGFFSSAAPLYDAVLPFIHLAAERVVVLANQARAAGACRDRLRYERAYQAVERLRQAGETVPASAFYHLAEGCRSFEEWNRAEQCCLLALRLAGERGNALTVAQAQQLLAGLRVRAPGDRDVVPPEGGEVDLVRESLLRKLRKHAPGARPRAVPPEKYPIEQ